MTDEDHRRVDELEAEAVSLLEAHEYGTSELRVVVAIELVEVTSGTKSPRLVSLLRLLAKLLARPLGTRNEDAVEHLGRALEIAREQDPSEVTLAGLYGQFGGALQAAGRLEEARQMCQCALEISTRNGGSSGITFDLARLSLVVAEISQEEAIPLLERLVALEGMEDAESFAQMMALSQLGTCLIAVGRGQEAIPKLEHALRILESRTKGAPHRWATEFQALIEKARSGNT
jgi:tetratricopeptide (TPR) repeat protein